MLPIQRAAKALDELSPQGSEGPSVSDGCDKNGFPGGCERAGHTVTNCPGFQIGDTVRFGPKHLAAGDLGVIVGIERWLNDNDTVPWDGVGDPPVYVGTFVTPPPERFLVRLQEPNPDAKEEALDSVKGWRERCQEWPHSYPFVFSRDLDLVSRPEIKVFNDSGSLGSVIGRDGNQDLVCVSDSAAGARKAIADMKAARCLPLKEVPR